MNAALQAILAQGEDEQTEFKTIDLGFQVTIVGAKQYNKIKSCRKRISRNCEFNERKPKYHNPANSQKFECCKMNNY